MIQSYFNLNLKYLTGFLSFIEPKIFSSGICGKQRKGYGGFESEAVRSDRGLAQGHQGRGGRSGLGLKRSK